MSTGDRIPLSIRGIYEVGDIVALTPFVALFGEVVSTTGDGWMAVKVYSGITYDITERAALHAESQLQRAGRKIPCSLK